MRLVLLSLFLSASWVSFSTVASAQETETAHVFAAELQLSILGPAGELGIAVEYLPTTYLAIVVGGGVSVYGYRAMLGTRLRLPFSRRHLLGLEGSLGIGPIQSPLVFSGEGDFAYHWDHALSVRIGVSYEYVSDVGFRFRAFAGMGGVLSDPDTTRCPGLCTGDETVTFLFPYVGVAFGYQIGA